MNRGIGWNLRSQVLNDTYKTSIWCSLVTCIKWQRYSTAIGGNFKTWDSQVSAYTPIHFSFTVPLKLQGMRSFGKPTQLRISKAKNIPLGLPTSPIKVWGKSVKGFLNYIRKNILNTKIIFKKYVEFEDISVATTAFYKTVRAIFLKQMQIIFWFSLYHGSKCIIKLGYILIQRYFMKKLILYQLCFFLRKFLCF